MEPVGWRMESPGRVQPADPGSGLWQVGQHSPSRITGVEQLVGGHTISSHTTLPRWQLCRVWRMKIL